MRVVHRRCSCLSSSAFLWLFVEVSYAVHPLLRRIVSTTQLQDPASEGARASCLADLDPHAGDRWEHPVLFLLCLGLWSHVCDLQPALQPLRDYAGAPAGPGVLLRLCPRDLRCPSAQVWCGSIRRVSEIRGFVFSKQLLTG